MLDSTQRTTAAELLWAAERDLAPADPLTETFPGAGIEVALYSGDQEIACGSTGAALGNPTACVALLARKMADFGVNLEAGHLILPGSCTQAIDARPGVAFRAEFAGLGTVTASFG
jgi:2-keto-4-pentenoate hydratase